MFVMQEAKQDFSHLSEERFTEVLDKEIQNLLVSDGSLKGNLIYAIRLLEEALRRRLEIQDQAERTRS